MLVPIARKISNAVALKSYVLVRLETSSLVSIESSSSNKLDKELLPHEVLLGWMCTWQVGELRRQYLASWFEPNS
jgi:hypothetical protein